MNDHPDKLSAGTVQELACLTAGCTFHVRYDPNDHLPAFKQRAAPYKELTVYLTCDNPLTRHTNRYTIKTVKNA